MTAQVRRFIVQAGPQRLDRFLAEHNPDLSRSRIQRLIEEGQVHVNGGAARAAQRLQPGDRVTMAIPATAPPRLIPEDIPLKIVYQDGDVLVVDKPPGMTVHPAPGHPRGTLVNALLALCPDLAEVGEELRPGIVHRLDKDTSGLMMVAKSQGAYQSLVAQLKERQVEKGYLALVWGHPEPGEGTIEGTITRDPRHRKRMAVMPGGREATTRYRVLRHIGPFALVEVFPKTGRTHQIRVHFAHMGHPLVGDRTYSRRPRLLGRHFLHAHRLGFRLPSGGEWVEFTSKLPADLELALQALEGEAAQEE